MHAPRYALVVFAGFALLMGLAPLTIHAQAPISPDRPGIGDGSAVMASGRLQLETGYSFVERGAVNQHNIGELLFRYGVVPGLEVRAALNSFVALNGSGAQGDDAGLSDAAVGLKLNLVQGSAQPMGRPTITLVGSTTLPTGSDALSSDVAQPTLKLVYDWPLSEAVTVSANGGYTFDTGDAVTSEVGITGTLGVSVPGTPGLGFYAGYAGFFAEGPDASFAEGGVTYLLTPNSQIDLNGAVGLSEAANDFFIGAGLAHRF